MFPIRAKSVSAMRAATRLVTVGKVAKDVTTFPRYDWQNVITDWEK